MVGPRGPEDSRLALSLDRFIRQMRLDSESRKYSGNTGSSIADVEMVVMTNCSLLSSQAS